MSKNRYELPKTRKEKIALLKAITMGKVKVEDLKEMEYQITLHLGSSPESREEWRKEAAANKDPNKTYITLDLGK